jgi:hypothetical protein
VVHQVVVVDALELLNEDIFVLFPFIEMVSFSGSWQYLGYFLEIRRVTGYLGVDVDGSGHS